MTSSEQLEHEAEVTRAQIVDALAELRERLTPGQVVDQALDYARDGRPAEFFRNLSSQVVDNPVPVALIGAGVAWLLMAGRGRDPGPGYLSARASEASIRARRATEDISRRASGAASDLAASGSGAFDSVTESASETAASWAERGRSAASSAAESARDASWQMRRKASSAYDATTEGARRAADAISRSASAVGSSAAHSGRSAASFIKDEPLVMAGIGLALGAILGASLPSTETEERFMGESSKDLKRNATAFAEEKWQEGKHAAEAAAEKAVADVKKDFREAAEKEGLMSNADSRGGAPRAGDKEPENKASLIPEAERQGSSAGAADLSARDVVRPGE